MTTVRIPRDWCPVCDHLLSAATSVGGNYEPRPGDLTLCEYCGVVLSFTSILTHRITTQEELNQLKEEERTNLIEAQRIISIGRNNG